MEQICAAHQQQHVNTWTDGQGGQAGIFLPLMVFQSALGVF